MGDAPLLVEVIHPRFEALDLLYHFDQVSRLADAQIGNELDRGNFKYVKHGRLWQAFESAQPGQILPVLLIDEIDKADADLPNALLDVMGNRSFQVPMLGHLTISAADGCLPLIIITTNEERELPAAFVRRCAVLNLNPPADNQDFIAWLLERGKVHRHLKVDPVVCQFAAQQVLDDRLAAANAGYPKVGLAEYIDLLTAVDQLTPDLEGAERIKKQIYWINRLSAYALVKNAGQSQKRAKRSAPDIPSN
jgi:MoxR-like ATPase